MIFDLRVARHRQTQPYSQQASQRSPQICMSHSPSRSPPILKIFVCPRNGSKVLSPSIAPLHGRSGLIVGIPDKWISSDHAGFSIYGLALIADVASERFVSS